MDQLPFEIRCEWGEEGLKALLSGSDAVILVDVLSFTTCLDVAVSRGVTVFPYRWKDETAREFARTRGGELAGPRSGGGLSLSPVSLLALEPGAKLVLPSPNGSTLSLSTEGKPTYAACLRNAMAVASAARKHGARVSVIAAGERWSGGALRPALEDWLGAGAVIECLGGGAPTGSTRSGGAPAALSGGGGASGASVRLSPEAEAAQATFRALRPRLAEVIRASGSGRELIGKGYEPDVALAEELMVSEAVPRLIDGAYIDDRG
jgi:2-phosphosulfolactate phosphatase